MYRLGLSATPSRYFDDEGSKFIIDYFGGTVYSFDLKRAINEINPETGKSYLTPYEYYPLFVELSDEEYEKYELFSKKISRQYAISKNKKDKDELLQRLLEKRQKIIVDCPAKYEAFNKILDTIKKDLNYCLVYCSDVQINETQNILKRRLITNHRFTGDEGIKPNKKYGGKSERQFILDQFGEKNPTFQILVAMKCLDEGVDVPAARTAVILASSGNPKQYIQRRGRILRRSPGKDKAVIYDILVLPPAKKMSEFDDMELEKKILRKELARYEEFAKISLNFTEALNIIFPIKRRYGIL